MVDILDVTACSVCLMGLQGLVNKLYMINNIDISDEATETQETETIAATEPETPNPPKARTSRRTRADKNCPKSGPALKVFDDARLEEPESPPEASPPEARTREKHADGALETLGQSVEPATPGSADETPESLEAVGTRPDNLSAEPASPVSTEDSPYLIDATGQVYWEIQGTLYTHEETWESEDTAPSTMPIAWSDPRITRDFRAAYSANRMEYLEYGLTERGFLGQIRCEGMNPSRAAELQPTPQLGEAAGPGDRPSTRFPSPSNFLKQ